MPNQRKFLVYEKPSVNEALNTVRDAVSERKTIILVGNCWVNYHGRASSTLEPGERILIVKEDGSVLVHRSKGYEPVNWQPPGCVFQARLENGCLVFKAVRQKPREVMTISFDRIYLLFAQSLVDKGEFLLYASEEDMQKAILLQPSLIEEGLRPITYEKKIEPGFIDVYGVDKNGKMVVIEIKRKTAGKEAALQLAKYLESLKTTTTQEIRGILVAPQISKGVQKLLLTLGMEFKPLDPKKCIENLRKTKTRKIEDFF